MVNLGFEPTTMSGRALARQTLLIYLDGGREAAEIMDDMEDKDRKDRQRDEDDAAGIDDGMTMPEGMSLREGYMGVIPPHA